MFKSTDCQSNQQIIILDPYWNEETIDQLRVKGRENSLVCPICKQPVHLRAGGKNRWHFAHKDLSNCPLKHESPNILQARSLLYKWLKSKYGDRVTIEKHFPHSDLSRPLDCYVEISEKQKFGYWILEKGVRSRFPIEMALSELNIT
jgi:competence CoiA-like predicted nuclease